MLTDSSPAVVRSATAVLRSHPELVAVERLSELLSRNQPLHVRHAAFRLLIARGTWIRIETDLTLLTDPDYQLRTRSGADLTNWLQREAATAYELPPASTRDRLGTLIDGVEPHIGSRRARLLRWHLGDAR